ncbi:MAG: hypothetical protein ABSB01_16935 [Streptosporangiaceae bacterium]
MSILTRKRSDVIETVTVRARLVPIAKNASPMAKNASRVAKDRADSALAWAIPYLDNARVWAAPRVERTGIAVRDNVAPRVSSLLVTTARRLEKAEPKPRRWPRMLATMAMLAAAGSAAAAVAMRRRAYSLGYDPAGYDSAAPVPDSTGLGATARQETANGDQAMSESEVNGQHRMA